MNARAANTLMPTAGGYCAMESSTSGDCRARTGARNPKFAPNGDQVGAQERNHETNQAQPS